jgi:hypothetical protein
VRECRLYCRQSQGCRNPWYILQGFVLRNPSYLPHSMLPVPLHPTHSTFRRIGPKERQCTGGIITQTNKYSSLSKHTRTPIRPMAKLLFLTSRLRDRRVSGGKRALGVGLMCATAGWRQPAGAMARGWRLSCGWRRAMKRRPTETPRIVPSVGDVTAGLFRRW